MVSSGDTGTVVVSSEGTAVVVVVSKFSPVATGIVKVGVGVAGLLWVADSRVVLVASSTRVAAELALAGTAVGVVVVSLVNSVAVIVATVEGSVRLYVRVELELPGGVVVVTVEDLLVRLV